MSSFFDGGYKPEASKNVGGNGVKRNEREGDRSEYFFELGEGRYAPLWKSRNGKQGGGKFYLVQGMQKTWVQ